MHSHDVRALAIWPPYSTTNSIHRQYLPVNLVPIVVSGGLDASVSATPASLPQSTTKVKLTNPLGTSVTTTFEDAYHRRIVYCSGFNGSSAVYFASQARLILCLRETSAAVWRIPAVPTEESDKSVERPTYEEVLDMDFNVQTNLVSGAISSNGKWLVVSDQYEVKLFSLTETESGEIHPKRIRDFALVLEAESLSSMRGTTSLAFTPDSEKLIAGDGASNIFVVDLSNTPPRLLRRFDQHKNGNLELGQRVLKGRRQDRDPGVVDGASTTNTPGISGGVAAITRIAVSTDGQWLATTDDCRQTHIFNLDTLRHHSQLPSPSHAVRALGFSPAAPALLMLGYGNNTFDLWDVEARQTPPWARQVCETLPKHFTDLHDPLIGIALPPPSKTRPGVLALFWGATWLCKVDFSDQTIADRSKKRRRSMDGEVAKPTLVENFKLLTQYRQILLSTFVTERELVVVERPLVDMLAKLPPAYFKPKYGAS